MKETVTTSCSSHCIGNCVLRAHVSDGAITHLETDAGAEHPQLRACLRGRAYRQRLYDPDRVSYPMRRTGERGEGKFERISWDEAMDAVVGGVNRTRNTHGPAALLFLGGGGDTMELHRAGLIQQVLAATGGYSTFWGFHSFEGGLFASMATFGTLASMGDPDDLVNSKLVIMWGWDPTTTTARTNTAWHLLRAREGGTRFISVDPRYTPTAALLAEKWIPIIPGTDAAMLLAMAHAIIVRGLCDRAFITRYTVGFEEFRGYVLGESDGVARSPSWAEAITGVPAGTIESLAVDYATSRPAALIAGIAAGRTAYGEQYHRAAEVLAVITGNIGVHGGWVGRHHGGGASLGAYPFRIGPLPASRGNPVEQSAGKRPGSMPTFFGWDNRARIHFSELADAILRGTSGGFPSDIKMLMVMHTNPVNQYANTNKTVQALRQLDFIVVAEQAMTATARFADILLPVSTLFERNDMAVGGATPLYTCVSRAMEPLNDSKSPLELCREFERRLGVDLYASRSDEEWLGEMVRGSEIPDAEGFRRTAVYRVPLSEARVAFKKEIENPDRNPFPTPSGKIEISSGRLAAMQDPMLPPLPSYVPAWEGRDDPLAAQYPLQLITSHFRRRTHSQFERAPWLRELVVQGISINPADALPRDIKHGDLVLVFNSRGEAAVPAIVTERIMPGVVDLPEGAWYAPGANGADLGGCPNVLTRDARSPGGAACHNTSLVQVRKLPASGSHEHPAPNR